MPLTRSMLKGMGLSDEQQSAIIEEHVAITTALKDEIKELKKSAELLPEVQKELDELRKDIADNDWQNKYNKEHADFEKYKNEIAEEKKLDAVKSAYKSLLTECKVGDKHVASIMKVTDFSNLKLDKDGKLEGVEDLKKSIGEEWSGFIQTSEVKGANVSTPPAGKPAGNESKSRAAELAAKYYENLYGKKEE